MLKKIAFISIIMGICGVAYAGLITPLLTNVSSIGPGAGVNMPQYPNRTFQAVLNGASSVSATVTVQGSNNNTDWSLPLITITLPRSSDGAKNDGAPTQQTWTYLRGNLIAISGVGASVTLTSGE